jgi:hypothetical protein
MNKAGAGIVFMCKGVILLVVCCVSFSKLYAEPPVKALPSTQTDFRSGVYNSGKAAAWDFSFLDYLTFWGHGERRAGYAPDQPLPFNHKTHVEDLKMDCQYCHWQASKATAAGMPEVQDCIGCHGQLIPGTSAQAQQEIKKVREFWNRQQPIPWVKVYVMPDHVKFNHKRHELAGITCQQCHGQVDKMEVTERVSAMKMGWCIKCHKERSASVDCYSCHR